MQGSDKIEAEVTRDEFGGYCCKRWGKNEGEDSDCEDFENIWALIGCDIEKMAQEIVK